MEDHEAKLGAFFRHIRKRRGLKIRDVSAGISETTLSRFERGQIDLTISKLAPAMEAAEMDPADVLLRPSQSRAAFETALLAIRDSLIKGNKSMATAALHNYRSATDTMNLPLRRFNLLILDTLTQSIKEPTLYIPEDDQDAIVTFLERDDDWHHYEYMLCGELIYFMDQHHAERAYRIMVRSFAKRKHPVNDQQAYMGAIMNAIMRPLETDDLTFARDISRLIEDTKISPLDILNNYRRNLTRAVLAYKENGGPEQKEIIQHLLGSLDFVGSPHLASSDLKWIQRCNIEL
ncbi:helix-turn-helix domain-containing protein [Lacticaseibacillus sharpeae]|uniref:HTH cro/C1-type domain-containing protein n=1 Tax=Lacticaseibacillus sharpeae JCM 1186 = DSM 20505 TaxID=1291052 RepID=A0A0R1ZRI0_9LACO|nr:helix-turn-helix transcriptional regulator [Lacticaseibacillus sharpeae]KRM55812.1 hypothetical protein FC18_GL001006 [Lacticaseibacillus sharpeae JCM 1186 = DSM 20505]